MNKVFCHFIFRFNQLNIKQHKSLLNTSTFSTFRNLLKEEHAKLNNVQAERTKEYNIRRSWSSEDTEKLLKLIKKYGNKWKVFENYFPGRNAFCIRSHYLSNVCDATRWTLEEKKILQQNLGAIQDPKKINWELIQESLPKKRTIARIQEFYNNSMHPALNHGSWTEKESTKLKELVSKYGKNWEKISKKIKSRSEKQCRNKWAYEMTSLKKG
ncbi:uncharacterized protein BX663DRAFT_499743 [Cokeromyces recurvatus]|uniref:uncharacterized protein n=1 Tax=Cokeromyces recurvatus TaxID=90255 RepID=UPI00221EA400|nr:uncharacterized protein BX663DRAFT_499743 [Cokeromyces recurvatus]KAI7905445.1 hypothetical protein BX663DRAFT_499743 [Cokeromyces recurvatus]